MLRNVVHMGKLSKSPPYLKPIVIVVSRERPLEYRCTLLASALQRNLLSAAARYTASTATAVLALAPAEPEWPADNRCKAEIVGKNSRPGLPSQHSLRLPRRYAAVRRLRSKSNSAARATYRDQQSLPAIAATGTSSGSCCSRDHASALLLPLQPLMTTYLRTCCSYRQQQQQQYVRCAPESSCLLQAICFLPSCYLPLAPAVMPTWPADKALQ